MGIPLGLLGIPPSLLGINAINKNAATKTPNINIKGLIVIPPVSGFRSSERRNESIKMIGGIIYAKTEIEGLFTGDAASCIKFHLLALE